MRLESSVPKRGDRSWPRLFTKGSEHFLIRQASLFPNKTIFYISNLSNGVHANEECVEGFEATVLATYKECPVGYEVKLFQE